MTRRVALVVVANALVVAALVVLTVLVDHRVDTILYGDVFAIVALGLVDFLLWSTRRPAAQEVSDAGGV